MNKFFYEVKKIAKPGEENGCKLIGFILGSLFIDYLAGFYGGTTIDKINKDTGKKYKDFVVKYLSQYKADDLWRDIRSRLVHNYSVGGTYGFTHMEKDGKHFEVVMHEDGKSRIVLNLEDFLDDLEKAAENYLNDLLLDDGLYLKASVRYQSIGLISYIKPAIKN